MCGDFGEASSLTREGFAFVAEFAAGRFPIELPGDLKAITIHPPIPGLGFPAQSLQSGDSSVTQTLPREDPNLNLRLIEPTAVGRRVMDREAVPDLKRPFRLQTRPPATSGYDCRDCP